MPHVPKEHIALFDEAAATLGEVRLGRYVFSEVCRRAAAYEDVVRALEQISSDPNANTYSAALAKGAIEQLEKTGKSLTRRRRDSRNLVTVTILPKVHAQQGKSYGDKRTVLTRRPPARGSGGAPLKSRTAQPR